MTLNAINRFRSAAKRIFHNARLQGHTSDSALAIVQNQAIEIELMAIRPLAQLLASLFSTTADPPFTTNASKWAQLKDAAFWTIALLSEIRRFNREQSEASPEGEEDLRYQNKGIVNIQAQRKVLTPALTTLPLSMGHIYFPIGFLDTVAETRLNKSTWHEFIPNAFIRLVKTSTRGPKNGTARRSHFWDREFWT